MINAKNMKVSASTAFFGRSVPEIVHFYAEAGIDALEVAGMNVNRLDSYDLAGIKAECSRCGVQFRSLHLPFSREHSISHPEKPLRDKAIEINKKIIDQAASLGARLCVVHPSSEPIEDEMRNYLLDCCAESLNQLTEFAASCGIELAMENLPRTCLCNTSDEVISMLKQIPGLKTCFDLNHFLPWKESKPDNVAHIYRLKEETGDRLISIHASDYHFIDECHLFPLDGDNDWAGIIQALENTGYPGYFNYEIGHKHGIDAGKSLHDIRANFETLMKLGANPAD